ncbi:hypothetical protein [Alicyclobacillus sp. SO9]|uniref:hypothetical protein n=1 Tax=Alicyclobacillus sp. SO9 TaxID=2665646 RepID=UPI0018E79901|nr:hypothetical protein [Alicyclobacillus sp. SO9]
MDPKVEGQLIADVENLKEWRRVFSKDIHSLKDEVHDVKEEMSGVRDDIHGVDAKLETVLEMKEREKEEAGRRVPTWTRWTLGILVSSTLIIAGWFVEWAIFVHP